MDMRSQPRRRQWRPRQDGVPQGQSQGQDRRGRLVRMDTTDRLSVTLKPSKIQTDNNEKYPTPDRYHWSKPTMVKASDNNTARSIRNLNTSVPGSINQSHDQSTNQPTNQSSIAEKCPNPVIENLKNQTVSTRRTNLSQISGFIKKRIDVTVKASPRDSDVTPPTKPRNTYQPAVQTPLPVYGGDTYVNSARQKADFRPETKSSRSNTNQAPVCDDEDDDFDYSLDLEEGYAEYALNKLREKLKSKSTSGSEHGQGVNADKIQQTSAPARLTLNVTQLTPAAGDHVVQSGRGSSDRRGVKRKYIEEEGEESCVPCKKPRWTTQLTPDGGNHVVQNVRGFRSVKRQYVEEADETIYVPCKKPRRNVTTSNCRTQGSQ